MFEQPVVAFEGVEIVPPGVAVALGIRLRRGFCVDDRLIGPLDIVVHGVGDLAGRDALCEIPHQPVETGGLVDARRQRAVAAAQEAQLFVE